MIAKHAGSLAKSNSGQRISSWRGPGFAAFALVLAGSLALAGCATTTMPDIDPERIGGVYVYDITDPSTPLFQQYINLRDFAINPAEVCEETKPQSEDCAAAGDLEPEGVLCIPASEAPTGEPLIAVVHEVSDSITLYRIDQVR